MNLQPKCFKLLQLLSGHYFWANFFALQQAQQILSEKPSSEYLMHASCSIFTWKDWKIGEFSQSPHLNSYQILRHSFLNPFTSLQSNKYSKNLDIYSFTFVCKKILDSLSWQNNIYWRNLFTIFSHSIPYLRVFESYVKTAIYTFKWYLLLSRCITLYVSKQTRFKRDDCCQFMIFLN